MMLTPLQYQRAIVDLVVELFPQQEAVYLLLLGSGVVGLACARRKSTATSLS